jgi:hypothetical protein
VLPKTASLDFFENSRSSQEIGLCEKGDQHQHVAMSFLLIRKEKIQVQCRSVLIANNFLIALFITLRFSLDFFTGWPDHSAALFAI